MTNFIAEVRERRVLPAVGVFAASCWVLVEIVDRLVERYLLSPYLTDMVFWGLYSLIPAVLLVAWSHGKPGKDATTRMEKVGVPINALLTVGMLWLVFAGKDLGARASMVEVANEDGQMESRLVASENHRRRLAVFFFTNQSGDPGLDWVQYGITELLVQDLQQNPFVAAASPWWAASYYERMRQAGFDDAVRVPRSLLRDITADANRQYFVEGDVDRQGQDYRIVARVWDSRNLQQVASTEVVGADLNILADRLSDEIREALGVPGAGKLAVDLPLAETYGESEQALQSYIEGLNASLLANDAGAADAAFDRALEADPGFVLGWFAKGLNLFQSGDATGAQAAFAQASALDYRLPERDRLTIKLISYRLSGQIDKAIALARMQAALNNDAQGHATLATYLLMDGQFEAAERATLDALEKDPLNIGLYLTLSALERAMGDADAAIAYIERYLAERPDDDEAMLLLADLLRDNAHLNEASGYYERAQLIADNPVVPLLRLSDLALRKGDTAAARNLLQQAAAAATTPMLATQVHGAAFQLEYRLGRIDAAIEQAFAQAEVARQALPPFSVSIMLYSQLAGAYISVRDYAAAEQALAEGRATVQPPMDQFFSLAAALLATAQGQYAQAWDELEQGRMIIEQFGVDALRFQVDFTQSEILAGEGKLNEALELRKAGMEGIRLSIVGNDLTIQLPSFYAELVDLQIDAQLLEEAEYSLREGLRLDPNQPVLWLQQARLHNARGQAALARASLQYALAIWEESDQRYYQLQEALELLASLDSQAGGA
jgi:tetratricopeptide (TPR) repeat protein